MDAESVMLVARWEGLGKNGWRSEGIKKYKKIQSSHGDVKYSIGNGVAKETIPMCSGHGQWLVDSRKEWRVVGGGGHRGKDHDHCSSIMNKI